MTTLLSVPLARVPHATSSAIDADSTESFTCVGHRGPGPSGRLRSKSDPDFDVIANCKSSAPRKGVWFHA